MAPTPPPPHQQHRRKISFADLERTFRASQGPMVAPPHLAHAPQATLTAAQHEQQRQEQQRRDEAAIRISQKPTDRDVPDELSDVVVGDGVQRYARLRDVEKRLDAAMMRKRLDISDNVNRRYTRREGVLRVWISNTAEGQPWQVIEDEGNSGLNDDGTFEFGESSQATYRVKIEGRLLDDSTDGDGNVVVGDKGGAVAEKDKAATFRPSAQRLRFSHFFKALTIEFSRDPNLQPDGYSAIEWSKPQPGSQNPSFDPNSSEVSFDTLEFERKADENMNVTINLVRDEKNERFRLSPQLAEILDTEEEDRAGAVQGIWEYCRAMGLQEDDDKRAIVCDEPLRKLFQKDTLLFPYIPDLLMPHMQRLPPIQLHYTIRVDKQYIKGSPDAIPPTRPSQASVYDIRVPLPNPLKQQLISFHTSKSHLADLRSIVSTDDDLALLVQNLHRTNAKRKFYDNLAKDPQAFIKRWISSQQRDLEVVLAEATRGGGEDGQGEEWRRGGKDGVWGSQLAHESVGLWLARMGKGH